jgi:dipeptidyl aminopeptidase/acylaminoacyl peptidase
MKCKAFTLALIFVLFSGFNLFLFSDGVTRQRIDRWLLLGPAKVPAPETDLLKNDDAILTFNHMNVGKLLPVNGGSVSWTGGAVLKWRPVSTLNFNTADTKVLYLAAYMEPARWLQSELVIDNGELKVAAFMDGKEMDTDAAEDEISASVDLTHEKHLLVLKVVIPKGKRTGFNVYLENKEGFENDKVKFSTAPQHRVDTANILNMINVGRVRVSPDGRLAAVFLSLMKKEDGKTDRWMEILNTANGGVAFSSRNFGNIRNFRWMKHSHGFTFTKTKDDKTSIIYYGLNTNHQACIVKDIEHFSSYWWADNNTFLIYSTAAEAKDKKGYKYIDNLMDRSKFPDTPSSMYIFYPSGTPGGGVTHKISDGKENFDTARISPDSRKVLLEKSEPDYKNRPYTKTSFYLFDIAAGSKTKLLEGHHVNTASWAPDSKRLLFLGGPSAFNGAGKNLEEGKIPNDYDTQAYIYDLNSKQTTAISKNFDPSINGASWSASYNNIYFTATDKSYVRIFKYSTSKRAFRMMNTRGDVVRSTAFARKRNIAVFWGSGTTEPHRLYKLNLSSNRVSVLKDYNRDAFRYVSFGKYENWDYKTEDGKTVMGRIYFPVDFNPGKKYPCVVYYYGGTSPVTRDFGGRYPKNWYAANGYIVYVLQPTGTVGFGQDASAVHVNDWGKVTSEEIIAAVKELTRTHSYIDAKRIGAMGASYGGFLTQYLAAKTDVFAAYISHAGISSLSSYWGVGDWGYLYSGVATADSFPWNRKDIYVGHSPLFLADRIQDPLLLLHGDIDNNVPPGESYQMFAALKLLGKDAALVTFAGQQHFILEYKKRLQWMRTIIAWWDKHLKGEPEHWKEMYGK